MTTTIPNSAIEFIEQQKVQQAREEGFAFFPIRPENGQPGFVYSIGMAQHNLPEIICFFNTEEEAFPIQCLMQNICWTLIGGVSRFDRIDLLRTFCNKTITEGDTGVTYTPTFVKGDTYMYALKTIITRAVRYRDVLGMPQLIELRHESVPTIDGYRASLMLANS